MTEYQKKRLKEIAEDWIREIDNLPLVEPTVDGFDNSLNKPFLELEKNTRKN